MKVKAIVHLWKRLSHFALKLARRELTLLLLLLGCSLAIWSFAEIADEVMEKEAHAFDEGVLLSLRDPAVPSETWGPDWLEEVARDFTALGGITVLTTLTLFSTGYLWLQQKGRMVVFVIISIGGGILLSSLLKYGFDRPRPELVPHGSYVYTASFPSGHSMMAAIVYLTLGAILAKVEPRKMLKVYLMGFGIFLALAVGLSRVYLGVHWPTDVLAGWSGGAAYATGCWLVAHLLQRRGTLEG
ncbi:phosphatase PAP2 family protein [Verrucomicrobiaceae bacterium 227]